MAELCSFSWKSIFNRFLGYHSTDFVPIYMAYVKKHHLVSQDSFFFNFSFINKKLNKNRVKRKISNICHLPKKNAPSLIR